MADLVREFDIFLCHNRRERKEASYLAGRLKDDGLRPFLDEQSLIAGSSLSEELASAIRNSRSFAVLLGPSGIGSYQRLEIQIAVHKHGEDSNYPVICVELPGASRSELPNSLRHLVPVELTTGVADKEGIRRLVAGIRGSASFASDGPELAGPPAYRSMALRAEGFVQRPELDRLTEALTREAGDTEQGALGGGVGTVALCGAGGFGKTALAHAVCEVDVVRDRYPAGILWVTLGERPSEAQVVSRIQDVLRWWTRREPPAFETAEAAGAALREALSNRPVLLVVDDVWRASDFTPFGGLNGPARVLITTRSARAVPQGAMEVVVDALGVGAAVELLGQALRARPRPSSLERLARRLGEWPILLKLVNGQLRAEARRGVDAEEAVHCVEATLEELGLTAFDREDEEARESAVRKTVEASLRLLSPQDRGSYARLAVFREDEQIPIPVLEFLWVCSRTEAVRSCGALHDLSLIYRLEPAEDWMQIHDVMSGYLRREHSDNLRAFHGELVDRYRESVASSNANRVERYFLSRLPHHLGGAGRSQDLENLVFSFAWLQKKVMELGVNEAIDDYELLEGGEAETVLRDALRLSRGALSRDRFQLASQLFGRLGDSEVPLIRKLLRDVAPVKSSVWLRPLTASLEKPTRALVHYFRAHLERVTAITELDGGRFATGSAGGAICTWDGVTGELLTTLSSGGSGIAHLAWAEGQGLLAASDDGIARLWDLKEEGEVRSFEGHSSGITALALRGHSFLTGSEDGLILSWGLESEKPTRCLKGHEGKVNSIGFFDSRTGVSVGKDRTLRVWNLVSGEQRRVFSLPVFAGEALEVTASSEVIVGTFAGELQLWKPFSGKRPLRRAVRCQTVGIHAFCILGRSSGVLGNRWESRMKLWDIGSRTVGPDIHVPGAGVTALARYRDSNLLCGTDDGSLSVWQIDALKAQEDGRGGGAIYGLAPVDQWTVASASGDGPACVWRALDGELLRSLDGGSGKVSAVCALEANRLAGSCPDDGTVRIWNPQTGELISSLAPDCKPGLLASFGRGLTLMAPLASTGGDEPIELWEIELGSKIVDIPAMPGGVGALCTIDGRFILVGTFNGVICHLDLSTSPDRRNFVLRGHEAGVIALSLVGERRLASGSIDKTIRVWDLERREVVSVLRGHEREVSGLACISPRLLASGSMDHTIRIWDLEVGEPLAALQLDAGVHSLAIMPDRRTLVAGDSAGTVHFLRIEAPASGILQDLGAG